MASSTANTSAATELSWAFFSAAYKTKIRILILLGIYVILDHSTVFAHLLLPCAISCKTEVFAFHRKKIVPVIITLLSLDQINLGLLSMFCLLTML